MIGYLQNVSTIYIVPIVHNSQFLIHQSLHFLNATVALGDRLPARTRTYLREVVQQEIIQCFKQNHLKRPSVFIQTVY